MPKRTVRHLGYYCIGPTITPAKIERLSARLHRDRRLQALKRKFTVLAGATRLGILYLLQREPELCVCDLADILGTTVSATSHQLRILRAGGLVRTRRDAQTIYYALSPTGARVLQGA